ncbi:MAG TPA: sodium-dependent bicarbonate transport family permease [Planctomycetaceae bacterium]|nr:sodium-dependent bicarbonate transport family permease [Planctomycetaceae bacterium]
MIRHSRSSFLKLQRRPPNLWASMIACLACLGLMTVLISNLLASSDSEVGAAAKAEMPRALKVIKADNGLPKLTVSADGEAQTVLEVPPGTKVDLNGAPATLDDIAPGDVVAVETDKKGRVIRVEANRLRVGVVFAAGNGKIEITTDFTDKQPFDLAPDARVVLNGQTARLEDLQRGDQVKLSPNHKGQAFLIDVTRVSLVVQTWDNFRHNLFKPLLLFFYMGFAVPLLKVAFEFPHVIYQGLTIYLLVAIGWHGGEELAELSGGMLRQALMFIVVGFTTNFFIGIVAYFVLRGFIPKMRKVDSATVAAYYGSDSAGTFVTCVGVLTAIGIKYAAYMPVMLAVMEIPGCLVGLFLVSRLRHQGMDALGNMPDEAGYDPNSVAPPAIGHEPGHHKTDYEKAVEREEKMALEHKEDEADGNGKQHRPPGFFSAELLREVFLNPGLFLLFGAIIVGFISRHQGHKVTDPDDRLFVMLFQGLLCLFLLEMGMTAAKRLRDLKTAGWRFIVYGLVAPNIFATTGICVAHVFSMMLGTPLQLGTYTLFAVLCGAASYIAVPAIQRLAIPEASPTLPLAASLGLTFSYNVTIGIPVYIMLAQIVIMTFPVVSG